MPSSAAALSILPQGLVPIVLDIDVGGIRYCDSILWSLDEREMSPEEFGARTCTDLQLPGEFASLAASSIREQLRHGRALASHAESRERPLLARKVVLRVDILFNGQRFRDDISWDTGEPRLNSPEYVAQQTCLDLSLAKPFDAAIAFAMRRELVRVALGCAAVESSGAPRAAPPATLPRPDALIKAWRPRSAAPSTVTNALDDAKTKDERGGVVSASYVVFCSSHRARIAQEHPSLSAIEVTRIMGDIWRSMPPDKREYYERVAQEESAKRLANNRYQQQQQQRQPSPYSPAAPAHYGGQLPPTLGSLRSPHHPPPPPPR